MKKGNLSILVILAVAIVGAAGYFLWLKFAPIETVPGTAKPSDFKTVNVSFLKQLKELTVCGNWPIIGVSPGAQRTDPFAKQTANLSPMAASSSQECLPVNRQ
jgi:hypothetical protein